MVKKRENAPVNTHFYALFYFGRDLSNLNGLLDLQNHDTTGGELSQGFREVGRFKIAFSCAILRLQYHSNIITVGYGGRNFEILRP